MCIRDSTEELLTIDKRENPVSLQLFGSDPDIMSEIAKQIEDRPVSYTHLDVYKRQVRMFETAIIHGIQR